MPPTYIYSPCFATCQSQAKKTATTHVNPDKMPITIASYRPT